jgi:hypothetical protein
VRRQNEEAKAGAFAYAGVLPGKDGLDRSKKSTPFFAEIIVAIEDKLENAGSRQCHWSTVSR